MQETPKIGQLLEGNEGRDAVHVAIAPVVAGETLRPGEHVGFASNGEVLGENNHLGIDIELIGIVDPYLKDWVRAKEKFYLFLYPNTVTSLRHVWTHPAFKIKVPGVKDE